MNTFKMKSMLNCLLLLLFATNIKARQKPPENFSGHWVINVSESDVGKLDPARVVAGTIIIDQKKELLLMRRFYNGRTMVIDSLIAMGKPSVSVDTVGGYIRTSTITFPEARSSFVVVSDYKDNGGKIFKDMRRTETYSLSNNRKQLILLRPFIGPEGDFTGKIVFDLIMPLINGEAPVSLKPAIDFSGNWHLNRGLSNFTGSPDVGVTTIKIIQTTDEVRIDGQHIDGSGQPLQLKFDGTKQVIKWENLPDISKSVKWENEGKVMSIYGEGGQMAKDLYMLAVDGKTLTVHRLNIRPIAFSATHVYDKVE